MTTVYDVKKIGTIDNIIGKNKEPNNCANKKKWNNFSNNIHCFLRAN